VPIPAIVKEAAPPGTVRMQTPPVQLVALASSVAVTVTWAFVKGVLPIVPVPVPLKVKVRTLAAKAVALDRASRRARRI
jgi:hypothetical protein